MRLFSNRLGSAVVILFSTNAWITAPYRLSTDEVTPAFNEITMPAARGENGGVCYYEKTKCVLCENVLDSSRERVLNL